MKRVYGNILEAIGNTPVIRLNRLAKDLPTETYVKAEFMNPGGSIKDRIGPWLIEDAEKRGALKPGGTIVEGTSGNTGFGLAIAAAIKGYRCIFVLPDKMSEEKIRNLRAFGAKVVVTPTAVEPDDPRSYYSVSRRLAEETPNSIYIDQYNNPANPECHYKTTGPEILEQMPDIDVLIAGIGTGGTLCGVGKYLKEKKPDVEIVGVDPIGSIVYDYFKTGKTDTPAGTYMIEGIGEDFIPGNYDFNYVDDMVRVEDKESFLMTRDILTKEGLFTGVSSGSAIVGARRWIQQNAERLKGKKVLIVAPDRGDRYLSKVYDDEWMREAGFIERDSKGTVDDILHFCHIEPGSIVMCEQKDKISAVIEQMREKGISQIPVRDGEGWIKGVVTESALLNAIYQGKASPADAVETQAESNIEFVTPDTPVEKASRLVATGKIPLVSDPNDKDKIIAILAKIDVLSFLADRG